jgi:hypothetical protein
VQTVSGIVRFGSDNKSILTGTGGVLSLTTGTAFNVPSITGMTTPLSAAQGGTSFGSYAVGDLLYAGTTTTLARRAAVATGSILASAGTNTAPVWSATPTVTTLTGSTSLVSALYQSSAAKILLTGTGTGPSEVAVSQTTKPTCSASCGTSPSVVGSDTAMIVTMGSTGTPASPFTVTFNGTWAAAPSCVVTSALGTMAVGKIAIAAPTTTTTVIITTNGVAPATGDKYAIHCIGVQ